MRNEQRARRLPGGPGRSSASGASRGRKGRTERRDRAPPPSRRPIPAGPAPGRRGSTRASGAREHAGQRRAGRRQEPWALGRVSFSLKRTPSSNLPSSSPHAAPTAHRSSVA
uniref:Uncharacterized protein n=1 Tax=Rangifer tarandus platyrhynchus TaxID=3082113 RepID=A0ACB0E7M3_RANTA|nr:unnamed protein product [Rangifer tarandus platyrhynchus]